MKILTLRRGAVTFVDEDQYDRLLLLGPWKLFEGYVAKRINGVNGGQLFMHNVVMGTTPLDLRIDHIDGNKTNNTKGNLRFIPHSANCLNSGKTCVYPRTNGRYQASVSNKCLGTFDSFTDAVLCVTHYKQTIFRGLVTPYREFNLHLTDEQYYKIR